MGFSLDDIRRNPILRDKIMSGEVTIKDLENNPDLLNQLKSDINPELISKDLLDKINNETFKNAGFEELRQTAKKERNKGHIISIATGIIIFVVWILLLNFARGFFSFLPSELIMGLIGVSVFGAVGLIEVKFSKSEKKYKKNYKDFFVKNVLESVFDNVIYMPEEGIAEEIIDKTKAIKITTYRSEDYIEADYHGVHFAQSDVHSYYDSDSGRVTYFDGRWMIFDFNKAFKANLQLIPKEYKHTNKTKDFSNAVKYKIIEMEDVDFNKEYNVYAQDEHDAFYILTPHMMERIRKLSHDIFGDIILHFSNNQLHIGINNFSDSFETDLDYKIDPEIEMRKILYEIDIIITFIKELQLDSQLFR